MTPKLTDRPSRLEVQATSPSPSKHLVFQVEAPPDMPEADIMAFLQQCGHVFRDEDSVLLMRLGTGPLRDLTPDIVTEEARSAASPVVQWPKGMTSFTFQLDGPVSTGMEVRR